MHRPSATFHGRDIFAPVAAELAAGRCSPTDLGPLADSLVPAWVDEPTVDSTGVSGVVMTIDHFGNLISNIDGPLVGRASWQPLVQAGNHTFPLLRTYGTRGRENTGAGHLVLGGGDRLGGAECRRGARPEPGCPDRAYAGSGRSVTVAFE